MGVLWFKNNHERSQTRQWSGQFMVGEKRKKTNFGKNRGLLKPSYAFFETNNTSLMATQFVKQISTFHESIGKRKCKYLQHIYSFGYLLYPHSHGIVSPLLIQSL